MNRVFEKSGAYITWGHQRREERKRNRKIVKEIMAKNLLKLMGNITHIPEAQ